MGKSDRIKELVELLDKASRAYYQESREIMSNLEYDRLYDELCELEKDTGIIMANSPTVKVGYEILSELPKEIHEKPMLSLDKTKEVEVLKSFLEDKEGLLSWKLDGLTVVLTYEEGKLVKAVTRGNGEIGEVVTGNARTFKNLPMNIGYKGKLVLRGEAVIKYSDFDRINELIEDEAEKYKNPRNLCAGSVRQLNNEITAGRNVHFYAFNLVSVEGYDYENSMEKQFEFLKNQGFDVVEYERVSADNVEEAVKYYSEAIRNFDIPSDGLVLIYNDIEYGISLGNTAKFPRNGIAFKWKDELAKTKLLDIFWSPSRTGLINPVAIFEPVNLEGTTVSRASVHNVSIVEDLKLGIGDIITVYKANMIIPQINENLTKSGNVIIPKVCPVCNRETQIKAVNQVKSLYCVNEECPVKNVKKFTHFVSRDAFNIEGMSEETLQKFTDKGFVKEYADLFKLDRFKEEIENMSGFGAKSYENIVAATNKARNVVIFKLIYSLGISNIGLSNAKLICRHFDNDLERIINAKAEELVTIDGIGEVIAGAFEEYFANDRHRAEFEELVKQINIEKPELAKDSEIKGKTFVITGSVIHFENRNQIKDKIESLGGKVTGSVSANTDYLINNDIASNSSKNKKAKELNIPIITEEEFLGMIGEM